MGGKHQISDPRSQPLLSLVVLGRAQYPTPRLAPSAGDRGPQSSTFMLSVWALGKGRSRAARRIGDSPAVSGRGKISGANHELNILHKARDPQGCRCWDLEGGASTRDGYLGTTRASCGPRWRTVEVLDDAEPSVGYGSRLTVRLTPTVSPTTSNGSPGPGGIDLLAVRSPSLSLS